MTDIEKSTWPEELHYLPETAAREPAKTAKALRRWYPDDVALMRLADWLEARVQQNPAVQLEFYLKSRIKEMGCPVVCNRIDG